MKIKNIWIHHPVHHISLADVQICWFAVFFLVLKLKTRKAVATCDNLLTWVGGWIPIGSPKIKGIGLLLTGIPIRIPNHRAPNQQLSIRWPKQWTEQFPKQWIEETLWQNLRITIKNIAVPVTCKNCQLITKKIGFGMSLVSLSAWKTNHPTNQHSYFMWDGNSRLSRKKHAMILGEKTSLTSENSTIPKKMSNVIVLLGVWWNS